MSKNTNFSEEKECKCCHEWWFTSNIKQDLCPNCYDYFKQLKQQLDEKDKQIDIISRDNNLYKYNIDEQKRIIDDFTKQLAEKDNLIEFGREEIRKRNKRIDEIVERDKKLFDNKNKEIECLNKRIDRYENMFRSRIKRTGDMQKDIELYINQLAIQELKKVRNYVDGRTFLADYLKNRIKELKGE